MPAPLYDALWAAIDGSGLELHEVIDELENILDEAKELFWEDDEADATTVDLVSPLLTGTAREQHGGRAAAGTQLRLGL